MAESKNARRIAFTFLLLLGIVWAVPVIWLILNSFKHDADFITSFANVTGPLDYLTRLIPRSWTVENYVEMFVGGENVNTTANIMAMFKNSFIVSIAQTVGVVIITSLSAYAYERLNFKGGDKIFWALMYMSMFPNVVAILPQFRIANALGWVNNLNALIWPGMAGVFNIFLIRNFMKSIPKALDEAATIDGASSMQVYTRIILPSIAPVMIVVGLFAFNGAWNDYLWPLLMLTDRNKMTLPIALSTLNGQYNTEYNVLMAGSLISMIPIIIIYIAAQKQFKAGLMAGGIKG